MTVDRILQDLRFFYPEITLTVTILVLILAELVTKKNKVVIPAIALFGLIISMAFSIQLLDIPERFLFSNMISTP